MPTRSLPLPQKYTIRDFERDFPTDEVCLDWLLAFLYPDGIFCGKCGRVTKHHRIATRKAYSCDNCGAFISPTAGTIFHKSSTPLTTWFHAIYLMSATRCGISAMQLMRETGVTYKTAWRMFHQIRKLLCEDITDMSGDVEADETYIGGTRRGQAYKGGARKIPVGGVVERGGRVSAYVLPHRGTDELIDPIRERVLPAATIFTDELHQYNQLRRIGLGYTHKRIKHSAHVYVDGDVHTQTIEGFWSLVKRGISGVYHNVSRRHLQQYLNEYSFRYNHRKDDAPMFGAFVQQLSSPVAEENQPR